MNTTTQTLQRVFYRDEVCRMLGGITSEGLRKMIKGKRFPAPDVAITNRTTGWNTATLLQAGFALPADSALLATAPSQRASAS